MTARLIVGGDLGVGTRCTFMGTSAGAVASGADNTLVGQKAGFVVSSGASNTIIGSGVGSTTLTTGSGNILIGTSSAVDTAAAGTSNTLNIGAVITATGIDTPGTSTTTIAGALTIASGKVLKLGNAATTGLTAGVLSALTNASVVITDSAGQAYRIPCII